MDTPHDDQLVIAINGQVVYVYNKTGAGVEGPNMSLGMDNMRLMENPLAQYTGQPLLSQCVTTAIY